MNPFKNYSTAHDVTSSNRNNNQSERSYTPKDESLKERLFRVVAKNGDASMVYPGRTLLHNLGYILFNKGEGYSGYDGTNSDGQYVNIGSDNKPFVRKGSPTDIYLNNNYDSTTYEPVKGDHYLKYIDKTIQMHKNNGVELNHYRIKGKSDTVRVSPDEFKYYQSFKQRRSADGPFFNNNGVPVYDAYNHTEVIENPNDSTIVITPIDVFDYTGIGNSDAFAGRSLNGLKRVDNATNFLRLSSDKINRANKYDDVKSPIKK